MGAARLVEFDLRNRLFEHLLKMPPAYFGANPAGQLMSRLTSDVEATRYLTGGGIMLGFNTLLAYLTTIPMMWLISPVLTLVTFLIYPVIIWIMGRISTRVKQASYTVQSELGDISAIAQENFAGMPVIQSYVQEPAENKRFQAYCDQYFRAYKKLIHHRLLLFMVLAALSGFSLLAVLMFGGWQIIGGSMNLGDFVAFTLYLERLAWPTMALGWVISIYQQGVAALERLDEVFSATPSIPPPKADPAQVPKGPGHLKIRNLTFRYQNPYLPETSGYTSPAVLSEINLEIQPGQRVVLVGPIGSGKSTLLKLLPRLYEVPENTLFLDDQDITTLDLSVLRSQIVFMPQLNFLFSSTVAQNVAFGISKPVETVLDTHVLPATQTARIHEEILDFPQQYETLVGERGLILSGGQRQRVSLARALMLEAPVLVLDDPFSNVDAATEQQILEALHERQVFKNRTTLLATHRLSLARQADRVILMDQGRILATGTHEELLATQPLYQQLNRMERIREELGEAEIR